MKRIISYLGLLSSVCLFLASCQKAEEDLNFNKKGTELVHPQKEEPQAPKPVPPKKEEKPLKIIREKTAYKKRAKAELWNTIYRYEVKVSELEKEPWLEWENYRFLEVNLFKKDIFQDGDLKKGYTWMQFLRYGNNEKLDGYHPYTPLVRVTCGRDVGTTRSLSFDKGTNKFSFPPMEGDRFASVATPTYNAHVRDLISLKYDPERDVLLLKTKTPIFDKDGENATYELRPRKESLVIEAPTEDGKIY